MWTHRILALLACALGATLVAAACAHQPPVPPPTGGRVATLTIPPGAHAIWFLNMKGEIVQVLDPTDTPVGKVKHGGQTVTFSNDAGFDRIETITILFTKSHLKCTVYSGGHTFTYPCH